MVQHVGGVGQPVHALRASVMPWTGKSPVPRARTSAASCASQNDGRRVAEQRGATQREVGRPVGAARAERAQQDAGRARQGQCRAHQQQRRGQPLDDHVGDGATVHVRRAQIAAEAALT